MNRLAKHNALPRLNARHAKAGFKYLAKLRLLGMIRHQVKDQIAALRKAQDLLDRTTQTANGIESQGYVADLAKYNVSYRMVESPRMDSDMASENDSFAASIAKGMNKAESEFLPKLA